MKEHEKLKRQIEAGGGGGTRQKVMKERRQSVGVGGGTRANEQARLEMMEREWKLGKTDALI